MIVQKDKLTELETIELRLLLAQLYEMQQVIAHKISAAESKLNIGALDIAAIKHKALFELSKNKKEFKLVIQ